MNSNFESIAMLSNKQRDMIERLINEGWSFRDDYLESGHNGTPYNDVEFKSPNMKMWAKIHQNYWVGVTENYLLEREAHHVADEWARNVFNYTSVITNPLGRELKEHFIKTKNCKFDNLYATNTVFDIKISKKIENNKPKLIKVKITIE